jgi:hypothetical protein
MTHVRLTSSKTVWYSIFILLVIEWEQWMIAIHSRRIQSNMRDDDNIEYMLPYGGRR